MDTPLDPLPPGITVGVRPDSGEVDMGAFRAAVHHAARLAGGRVVRFEAERVYTSYVHAVVEIGGRTVAVLCNCAYPVVAFSDTPGALYLTRGYVDAPALGTALAEAGFAPVPLAVLTASPDPQWLDGLGEREQANARHWIRHARMTQVGDVVFNDWD